MRTDRHNHRPIAGDSDLAEGVKLLARAHQSAIWSRQRQLNALRSSLREYYPGALAAFGTDLASTDALAVLSIASTPELGRGLSRSKIASALRKGGRQRNVERRAEEIQEALRAEQLEAPELITNAHGLVTRSALALIATFNAQIAELEAALSEHFEQHPDAKVVLSLPGLGTVLGARVLGEFGDDRTRFSGSQVSQELRRHVTCDQSLGPLPRSSWPASPATAASATPATSGPSARSPQLAGSQAATTTSSEPEARPTDRPSDSWPTAWSGSSTSALSEETSTTRRSLGRRIPSWPLDFLRPWDVYRRRRWRMTFDMEATFSDDYPYFYAESIDDQHSDADAAEILGLLQLETGVPRSSTYPAATAASPVAWPRRGCA